MLKTLKLFPRRTIIIQLSWLGALLLVSLAVIYPMQRAAGGLDREIKEMKGQLDEQKALLPIYEALKVRNQTAPAGALPTPERSKLSRRLVGTIPFTFRKIARESGMEAVSVTPDVPSLLNQPGQLLVHLVVRGDFMNFRKFLVGVGQLPYLERVEGIEIQPDPYAMEYKLKIRLAMG
jgi:hypothetical protein